MIKGANQKILLLAVILGLITSGVVFFQVSKKNAPAKEKLLDVVVATVDIDPRQIITSEMIEVKKMPEQFAHPLAFSSSKEIVGKVAKERILSGEAILKNRVLKERDSSRLSSMIPPGKRAVTVSVNGVSGVAGMLQPGDFVDIMATFDENIAGEDITTLFLQNIEILAVAQEIESKENKDKEKAKGGKEETTITFLVTPWEGEQLALAGEKGILRLALRPFQPDADVFATNVVLTDLTRLPKKLSEDESQSFPEEPLPPNNYYPPPTPPEPVQEVQPVSGKQIEVIKGTNKEMIEVQ